MENMLSFDHEDFAVYGPSVFDDAGVGDGSSG
jgi:hypothetical protein